MKPKEERAHCPICKRKIGRPIGRTNSAYERDMKRYHKVAYCGHCGRGYNSKEIVWR